MNRLRTFSSTSAFSLASLLSSSSSSDDSDPPQSPVSTASVVSRTAVLVLGASTPTGAETLRYLGHDDKVSSVHAFCEDPYNDLSLMDMSLCETIHKGDARNASDIEAALTRSRANWIVVADSNENVGCCRTPKSSVRRAKQSTKRETQASSTDSIRSNRSIRSISNSSTTTSTTTTSQGVRTASAEAIVEVLLKPQFRHVRAVVISRAGAGGSKPGLRPLQLGLRLRAMKKDLTGLEQIFGGETWKHFVDHQSPSPKPFLLIPFSKLCESPSFWRLPSKMGLFQSACQSNYFKTFLTNRGLVKPKYKPSRHCHVGNPMYNLFIDALSSMIDADLVVVFHGTLSGRISRIIESGMDARKRKRQTYGVGDYFSTDPAVASNFSDKGKTIVVFVVIRPEKKPYNPSFKLCPSDHVIVPNVDHQLPIGTVSYKCVTNGK